MSTLLEKKHIIHMITEVVVILGVIFYFSSKNKKLLNHIENLSKRLEEQEDIIQKHEKIITQLIENSKKELYQAPVVAQYKVPVSQSSSKKVLKERYNENKNQNVNKIFLKGSEKVYNKKYKDNEEVSEIIQEEEEENNSSDLDNEIAEELEELEENQDDGLKKKT